MEILFIYISINFAISILLTVTTRYIEEKHVIVNPANSSYLANNAIMLLGLRAEK